jgi:1-acyl-sn-glycerol-3-phosphate acyltransferase
VILVPRAPDPNLDDVAGALRALGEKARARVLPSDLAARDPRFIERVLPLLGALYDRYFRCETELEDELPSGPFLAVANHNGMTGTPDMFCHMVAFWRRHGAARAAYGLMHDVPFRLPVAGPWLNASGALAAHPDNARRALDAGAAVLVFPGGDLDACKPFRDRYRIDFGARRGFLRVAIRHGVPLVPIVSAGAHHSLYLVSDGHRLAEALGLPRLARSNVLPLGFALPFGLVAGIPYPHLPPPVKVHTRFLRRIDLGLPPSSADDPAALEQAHDRVVGAMRAAMDDLRRAGRHGLFPRAR